jgi:ubiquinone/menaquinone biosynthesis C-methylase UbiE
MLALDLPDDSMAGIVSFYAIIHLKRDEVTAALSEMNRVLQPGGNLLIAFHDGEGELRRDEWYGLPVSIDVTLMTSEEMMDYLEATGFNVDLIIERPPYDFEYPTRRIYIQASKPGV